MTHYIRCPECTFCIGAYQEFVDQVRLAMVKSLFDGKYAEYDPSKMAFNDKIVPNLEELFNALEIDNRCCRMHLVAKTDFNTYL